MKRTIITLSVVFLINCTKEKRIQSFEIGYLKLVCSQLKSKMPATIFDKADFSNAYLTRLFQDSLIILRIPFIDKKIENDFILVRTDEMGNILRGKIITISEVLLSTPIAKKPTIFDGNIIIRDLAGSIEAESTITGGFIDAFHKSDIVQKRHADLAIDVRPPETPYYTPLPEIIILGAMGSSNSFNNPFYNLNSMLTGHGGTGSYSNNSLNSGFYSPSYQGYSGGTGNGSVTADNPVQVDFGIQDQLVINLDSYLKAFELVPDEGALCSIEIFTDIPVDTEPTTGFDWRTGSPGHTFLQIGKKNKDKSVVQNIGFYPASQWKTTMTTAPIAGVFVDNKNHEYNASFKIAMTPMELRALLAKMGEIGKSVKYDIDDYNCTDFALEIFNFARRNNPLTIPRYDIPGAPSPYGSNTPQGLYMELKKMKESNSTDAANIEIPGVKGYVGSSFGTEKSAL